MTLLLLLYIHARMNIIQKMCDYSIIIIIITIIMKSTKVQTLGGIGRNLADGILEYLD